jgi:hypothetical protein
MSSEAEIKREWGKIIKSDVSEKKSGAFCHAYILL